MSLFHIKNHKYDIEYDVNFDSFNNFIQSLKESKKYYHDLCKKEKINIDDFNNEYLKNIDMLRGELLKYYILVNNDKYSEKYIVINDNILDFYNFMINKLNYYKNNNVYSIDPITYPINYLTRNLMNKLIDVTIDRYVFFESKSSCKLFLNKFQSKHITINEYDNIEELPDHYVYKELLNKSKEKLLDSIDYETIYERELENLISNLFDVCLSNIKNKNDSEYIPVD